MSRGRLLLNAGIAAFVALMLAGPGGAVFPSTFRWATWAACPHGDAASRRFRESYNRPGETQVAFTCVGADGVARDRTLAAIGGLWVMYFMAGCVVLTLLSLRRGSSPADRTASAVSTGPVRPVPADLEAKVRELVARGQKITAIKVVRMATGMGLKEAKDWVDALPSRSPAIAQTPVAEPGAATGRLAELKRMLDAGLITQPEYDAKKGEILAEL
jgi:ribosomal L7/L12-like protein/putative oligomerization/nucleic acid binding protein